MNTELQNLAWSVLPKEYREEVKKMYCTPRHRAEEYTLLQHLFGVHNLTSDAEGEEMLTVSAITVREMYAANERIKTDAPDKELGRSSDHINHVLRCLFGSKCLPEDRDNLSPEKFVEPSSQNPSENCDKENLISTDDNKPDEPKFKVGDKVVIIANCKHKGEVAEIIHVDKDDPICAYYLHNFSGEWYSESDLEPYTEPDTSHETPVCENHSDNTSQKEVNVNSNRNLSKDCDKQFDTILKDSFRNERRLNVAVQMVKAIMQCPEIIERIASAEADSLLDDILHDALYLTDRLMSECEKGGSDE